MNDPRTEVSLNLGLSDDDIFIVWLAAGLLSVFVGLLIALLLAGVD